MSCQLVNHYHYLPSTYLPYASVHYQISRSAYLIIVYQQNHPCMFLQDGHSFRLEMQPDPSHTASVENPRTWMRELFYLVLDDILACFMNCTQLHSSGASIVVKWF